MLYFVEVCVFRPALVCCSLHTFHLIMIDRPGFQVFYGFGMCVYCSSSLCSNRLGCVSGFLYLDMKMKNLRELGYFLFGLIFSLLLVWAGGGCNWRLGFKTTKVTFLHHLGGGHNGKFSKKQGGGEDGASKI